jgi:hypothetical protein
VKAVATTNNLCLSWNSIVGTNYVVEAKTNVQDTAWNRVSPLITAATTNTEHCVALPSSYRFFRVALAGRVSLSRFPSGTAPRSAAVSSQSNVIEPQVR